MAGITDEVSALDFDLACSLRLQIYDNRRERNFIKQLGISVGCAFAGEEYQTGEAEKQVDQAETLRFDESGQLII